MSLVPCRRKGSLLRTVRVPKSAFLWPAAGAEIGGAISFVTPDDEASVRDLEKMTHKRVERNTVKGFDYSERAAPPVFHRAPGARSIANGAGRKEPHFKKSQE